MTSSLASLLAAAILQAAAAAATHPFSVRDMLAMDRISDPQPSPDGKLVAFTVRTTDLEANKGAQDVWVAPVDGGAARRVTTSAAQDSQARWAPDGRSLYFLSTRSGSSQVWRLGLAGGEAEQVTSLPRDVEGFAVSPAGGRAVVAMAVFPGKTPEETARLLEDRAKAKASGMVFDRLFVRHWDTWKDGTRLHLFSYDLAARRAVDLMPAMDADCPTKPFGGPEDFTVSPDGATVVFSARDAGREEPWSTNLDLFAVPADASAAPRRLTANPAWDAGPVFSPDGRLLAYRAMSRPGYEADRFDVVLREWPGEKERRFTLRADGGPAGDRSPGELAFSADGKELYATADDLGRKALFALDVASGRARRLVQGGSCADPRPLRDGRVVFAMDSLRAPAELHVVARRGGDPRRLTRLNDARVAAARMGEAEPFTFAGAKGDTVHGWLVRPADFDPSRKYPVAFIVHGGPQGSMGDHFHYRWNPQAFAGGGYGAVFVDFHGSTGYGQAFTDAIRGDWGGAPFEDVAKGLDAALARFPFLDGGRVAALGASYGGYMMNWLAGKLPDRFRAIVCHDGVFDPRAAYFDTEELWFPEWEYGGTPWERPDAYAKHDPVELVKSWKTPTLVIHGEKDFRVTPSQGLGAFTALQRRGVPSRLLYFPDENHWVLKPANSIQWHEEVLGWLDRWTVPAPAGQAGAGALGAGQAAGR